MNLFGPLHGYSTDVCGRSISSTSMVISVQRLTKPKEEICTVYIKIVGKPMVAKNISLKCPCIFSSSYLKGTVFNFCLTLIPTLLLSLFCIKVRYLTN